MNVLPSTGIVPENLFTVAHKTHCTRCERSFASMPSALRSSGVAGLSLCFNCAAKITKISGVNAPPRRPVRDEVAAVGVGLVTTAIKKENTLNTAPTWAASIRVLRRDVIVKRILTNATARLKGAVQTVRENITELSSKALRRMVQTARNIQDLPIMCTLTYPADFPTDGKAVKYHWQKMRQWLQYRGVAGFWFMEFQERGAPHFHLYLDKYVPHEDVRRHWYKVVGSGDRKHLHAGTRIESLREDHALAAYAGKYAAKAEQKDVPEGFENVGRFWGRFGGVAIQERLQVTGDLRGGEGGERAPVADAVQVVARLHTENRNELIAQGKKVLPVSSRSFGWGMRSFTTWDTANVAMRCLSRLSQSINRCVSRPLAVLTHHEQKLRGVC